MFVAHPYEKGLSRFREDQSVYPQFQNLISRQQDATIQKKCILLILKVEPSEKMNDPYFKLKPESPTPPEELCNCAPIKEIYLAHKLGRNPLYCLQCNGEIPPEKLDLENPLVEQIASWNSTYGALYLLWLDSGEYELWAKDRLLDVEGQVNKDGFKILKALSKLSKTYYLWFRESYEGEMPSKCPICDAILQAREGVKFLLCEQCQIII